MYPWECPEGYFCFRSSCSQINSSHLRPMFTLRIIHLVRAQNFLKQLTFLTPCTNRYMCVSRCKECYFFGKFCVRTKWMIPYLQIKNLIWTANGLYMMVMVALNRLRITGLRISKRCHNNVHTSIAKSIV